MLRRKLSIVLFLILCIATSAVCAAGSLPTGSRLKDIAVSTKIGVRPDGGYPTPGSNSTNTTVINREFNAIQPTWYANWGGMPAPYSYSLDNFNSWVNWGVSNSKYINVHMLAGWNLFMPSWFVNGTFSNTEMDNMLWDMIRAVIQSNSNNTKVHSWNVVNEMFRGWDSTPQGAYRADSECKWNQLGWEADQSGLTGSDKINNYHPVYISKAFQYAREFTNAKLEIRDYGFEFDPNGPKFKALYQLCRHLKNKGVPLDAVGLQCHMWYSNNDSYNMGNFKTVVQKFKDLGLMVYVAELDIGRLGSDANQKARYKDIIKNCKEAGVDQIYIWGVRDGSDVGWRDGEQPLLFNENFDPKQAYYGVQEALNDSRKLLIRAKGDAGSEKIELRVNNVVKATWQLSKEWADYCYTSYSGTNNVKIAFVNDGSFYGNDKNVQIDYLMVNGTAHQAENQAVNTGYQGYSEWMFWNGYIDFGTK